MFSFAAPEVIAVFFVPQFHSPFVFAPYLLLLFSFFHAPFHLLSFCVPPLFLQFFAFFQVYFLLPSVALAPAILSLSSLALVVGHSPLSAQMMISLQPL